jgi:hypothetical protein
MSDQHTFGGAFKKLLAQPSFLIAAGVLLISAISLNAATEYLQLYFKKNPVEMSAPFTTIPPKLGHWVEVSKDEKLPQDMEHVLGATHYLYRDYVDDRLVSEKVIKDFDGKTFSERKGMVLKLQQMCPQAVMMVGLTYYTGMVDTVAHIPDRCYIADGFEPTGYNVVSWSAFDNRPGRDPRHDDVRYINFEDQVASRQSTTRNVAYFFHANGSYTSDPIGVRVKLQDLSERYAYYSKIELMTQMSDTKLSADVMNDFLTSALPEIERCLPDWSKVKAQAAKK